MCNQPSLCSCRPTPEGYVALATAPCLTQHNSPAHTLLASTNHKAAHRIPMPTTVCTQPSLCSTTAHTLAQPSLHILTQHSSPASSRPPLCTTSPASAPHLPTPCQSHKATHLHPHVYHHYAQTALPLQPLAHSRRPCIPTAAPCLKVRMPCC